jgi:integrase
MKKNKFPALPGVVVKATKNGHRYLLHSKDSSGRDIYATIPVVDTDTKTEYLAKVEKARIKLNAKKNSNNFQELIEEYISVRQLSKNTVRALIHDLDGFGLDDAKNRARFLDMLKSGQKSINTRRAKISAFFRWLILHKRLDIHDPTDGVRIREKSEPRTRVMTADEEVTFFREMAKEHVDIQLCLRLAYFTGARLSSIMALNISQWKEGKLHYFNVKCGRPYAYKIPLTDPETIRLLNAACNGPSIFTLTQSSIQNRVYAFFRRNFPKKDGQTLTIHSLRHTLATRLLQSGVSPDIIARILDHRSVSTTLSVYARHSQDQIDGALSGIFEK